jgi:hypothetical protein
MQRQCGALTASALHAALGRWRAQDGHPRLSGLQGLVGHVLTRALELQGLPGLVSLDLGRAPVQSVVNLVARVSNKRLSLALKDGCKHARSGSLAAELGDASFSAVQFIWRRHGLQPHRLKRHVVSSFPDFDTRAVGVISLFRNPPAHAAVYCQGGETAIQVLDRNDRKLPLVFDCAESHGIEYKLNGTFNLFAVLNTVTGEVPGISAPRHTSEPCFEFLGSLLATQPLGLDIHAIFHSVSSHRNELAQAFLSEGNNVQTHHTPTYSSLLNKVDTVSSASSTSASAKARSPPSSS